MESVQWPTVGACLLAGFFLAMGVAALVRPAWVVGRFDVAVPTAAARNEVRAVYGGFGLAVGAGLLWSATDERLTGVALLAVAFALLGMAAGRLVSAVIDRTVNPWVWTFFAVETILGGLAIYLGLR